MSRPSVIRKYVLYALALCAVFYVQWVSDALTLNADMWKKALAKIERKQEHWYQHHVPLERHVLVIYHIGDIGLASNSLDIATNNIKIFLGAMDVHTKADHHHHKAFYLFNVVDGHNSLLSLIPAKRSNVASLKWSNASSDLETHLHTLHLLGPNITHRFSTVIFSNQGVRGPLAKRADSAWIREFRKLLASNNVGLAGPTMSCEVSPHIQTHMFALRASVIPHILKDMEAKLKSTFTSWRELVLSLEVGLTGVVRNAGYNISSFLYQSRGQPYFTHCLNYTGPPNRFDQNPTGWCDVSAEDILFMKWGGEPMRTPGMICNTTLLHMEDVLEELSRNETRLQLTVPEVMMGGNMYPLFKEYSQEAWIDRHPPHPVVSVDQRSVVCFLVRVIKRQLAGLRYENPNTALINKDIELLITTLRRQTDPHWLAFFYNIDSSPDEKEVRRFLHTFGDPRLNFVTHGIRHSSSSGTGGSGSSSNSSDEVKYDPWDAGYSATDGVLRQVLTGRPECRWVSVTTSDNAYGSEVVANVMKQPEDQVSLLLNPLDSRRFQEQDMLYQKQFLPHKEVHLDQYCGLLSSIQLTTLTFGVRPPPYIGSVDLAAAFFSAEKLVQENIHFGNFSDRTKYPCRRNTTDPVGYNCLGCQGAHLLAHLAQKSMWPYARLPIAGLRSVVFHGNSPTLCIGAGNVWVDHYDAALQRCITPKDALHIQEDNNLSGMYQLSHFFSQGNIIGTCLRARRKVTGDNSTTTVYTTAASAAASNSGKDAKTGNKRTASSRGGRKKTTRGKRDKDTLLGFFFWL